jgi:hypothetical protein
VTVMPIDWQRGVMEMRSFESVSVSQGTLSRMVALES